MLFASFFLFVSVLLYVHAEVSYSMNGNTLRFTGSGGIANFTSNEARPWDSYLNQAQSLYISNGITSIGSNAFSKFLFSYIALPGTITSIGFSAFSSCTNLNSILIPDAVTFLGSNIFAECSNLGSVTLPSLIKKIPDTLFLKCHRLYSINLPDSITSIGHAAFSDCQSVSFKTLPSSLVSIGSASFSNCIGISSLTLPDSLSSIGYALFSGCLNLSNVVLSKSLRTIPEGTFANCESLTSIFIPSSVFLIKYSAFYKCIRLTSITFQSSSITSIEPTTFLGCSKLASITLPSSITYIGDEAFYNCSSLAYVNIPASVTSIGIRAFNNTSISNLSYFGTRSPCSDNPCFPNPLVIRVPSSYSDSSFCSFNRSYLKFDVSNSLYKIDKNTRDCFLIASAYPGETVNVNIIIYIKSENSYTSTDTLIGFDFNSYEFDSTSIVQNGFSNSELSIPIFNIDFSFTCSDLSNGCWFPDEGHHFIVNSEKNSTFVFTICHNCTIDLLENSYFTDLMVSSQYTSTFNFPSASGAASCHNLSSSLYLGRNSFNKLKDLYINTTLYSGQYSWYIQYKTSPHSLCTPQTLLTSIHKICILSTPSRPLEYSNDNINFVEEVGNNYYYFVNDTFSFTFNSLPSPCSDYSITSSTVTECTDDAGSSSAYNAIDNSPKTFSVSRTLHCTQYYKYQSNSLFKLYSFDSIISDEVIHHFYFCKFSIGIPFTESGSNSIIIPVETWDGPFFNNGGEQYSPYATYSKCGLSYGNTYDISFNPQTNQRYINITCSEDTHLKIALSLSSGFFKKTSDYFDIHIFNNQKSCGISLPRISNFQLNTENSTNIVLWEAGEWGSNCVNTNCHFVLTQHTLNGANISFIEQSDSRLASIGNDLKSVSIQAQCIYNSETYHSEIITAKYCKSIRPSISSLSCIGCKYYNGSYFVYRTAPIFTFTVKEKGYNCSDYSEELKFVFYDFQDTFSNSLKLYSIKVPISFSNVYNQNPDDNSHNSLFISNYNFSYVLESFYKCIVPALSGIPNIISNITSYVEKSKNTKSLLVKFSNVNNLYSPCFGANATFHLYYWTANNPIQIRDSQSSNTYSKEDLINDSYNFTYTWNIKLLPAAVYYYRIVATNVLNEFANSTLGTLNLCSNFQDASSPILISPSNGELNVNVKNLKLFWNATDATRALRCSASETLQIRIELENEREYNKNIGPQTSISDSSSSSSSFALIKGSLLLLSTRYYWRISFIHKDSNDHKTFNTISSSIYSFTTVHKHCVYFNCNKGICNYNSGTCTCFAGYHGEFCDKSGLSSQVIGIIIGVICLVLFGFILILTFLFLKIKYLTFGLKIPDMSLFMFNLPKRINEDDEDPAKPREALLQLIKEDCNGNFKNAIDLLECTPVTDSDSICRSFLYCFEKEGKGLTFLIKLIEYEVAHSDSSTTLFRNNSYASKCFKVYGRMIGLPYLFQVIFPLLNKLYKEHQKESIEVKGIEQDTSKFASNSYELNLTNDDNSDIAYDAAIEENALLIQVACESFFNSLRKTMNLCPNEFRAICKNIETKVSQKFPEASIEVCLASFLFLRYFVAGITVPESFGIIDSRPDPLMRRRLILIAKVLSNMSTHVKFGDKEDYMIIMNDYLESKQNLLNIYFKYLLSDSNSKTSAVSVPEKFYEASLTVLCYAFAKKENGEWIKDSEECE